MNLAWQAQSWRARALAQAPAVFGQVALVLLVAALCALAGVAIAYLPWWLVVAVVLAPAVVVVGAVWPFPVLLLVLALVFEAIPGRVVPPVGSFRVYELIMLYLLAVAALRAMWRRENPLVGLGPFVWPLLYLLLCLMVSVAYVRFFARNANLLTELRNYGTWVILPLLVYVARSERQRRILAMAMVVISVLVALYAMTQSLFDVRLLANRAEVLDTTNLDVTRSISGGTVYLMVFTLLWMINRMVAGLRGKWWMLPATLIVTGGIAVSFGRGVWIATALAFVVASWLSRGVRGMLLSVLMGVLALGLLLSGFAAVKPRLAEAMVDRALGVSQEIKTGGSYHWRALENEYAFAALEKRPFTGVGLGGEYKQRFSSVGSFAVETRYIHNAYVAIMTKLGVQAILFPLLTVIVFSVVALRARRGLAVADRPLFGAVVGAFFVPVITSYTQPEWIVAQGAVSFSLFILVLLGFARAAPGQAVVRAMPGPPRAAPPLRVPLRGRA